MTNKSTNRSANGETKAASKTNDSRAKAPDAIPPKRPSKQQQLATLIVRDEGATLDQMIAATGWLPHTTRAALTGLKKKGYAISSDKVDGVRTYRGIAPE
jgi:hypothetical protein